MIGLAETMIASEWTYARLTGDPTLLAMLGEAPQRVWHPIAAEEAVSPYVVFSILAPHDVLGVGGVRIMTDMLMTVRAVSEGSNLDVLKPIAKRIDLLLHNSSGATAEGNVHCVRMNPIETPELRQGRTWHGLGGVYKFWVTS